MRGHGRRFAGGALAALVVGAGLAFGGSADEAKKRLGDDVELADLWIYDDLDAALAAGRKADRPILAVVRCPH